LQGVRASVERAVRPGTKLTEAEQKHWTGKVMAEFFAPKTEGHGRQRPKPIWHPEERLSAHEWELRLENALRSFGVSLAMFVVTQENLDELLDHLVKGTLTLEILRKLGRFLRLHMDKAADQVSGLQHLAGKLRVNVSSTFDPPGHGLWNLALNGVKDAGHFGVMIAIQSTQNWRAAPWHSYGHGVKVRELVKDLSAMLKPNWKIVRKVRTETRTIFVLVRLSRGFCVSGLLGGRAGTCHGPPPERGWSRPARSSVASDMEAWQVWW
jgi:hypothetical protein